MTANSTFATSGANIFLTNLLTGQTAMYNPLGIGNDNITTPSGDIQNSAAADLRLPERAELQPEHQQHLSDRPVGWWQHRHQFRHSSAPVQCRRGSEPATWAMMLIGFGAMGVSLRRRRRAQTMFQAA